MDTQNTPVHLSFWHRDFWMLAFANLLLMMSAYALLPTLPFYLMGRGLDGMETGLVMGAYGVGLFLLGGFCSYWVQRYRRNHVCQIAILSMVGCMAMAYYLEFVFAMEMEFRLLLIMRIVLGATTGLAAMVLGSTLAIDICESFQRTAANHIMAWFGRFALALGPLAALLVFCRWGYSFVPVLSGGLALCAWLLITLVKFPFKAPSEKMRLFSLDRFFLPQGFPLFANLLLIMMAVGILVSQAHGMMYYVLLFAGMALAVLAERYAFANAELKSEVLTGLILLMAAVLIDFTHQTRAIEYISPMMIGFAAGIIGSRFLLFYLKLSKHCQRGTSQSSYFLAWETGISLGVLIKWCVLTEAQGYTPYACLGLLAMSLALYNFLVHPWYMKHRNR